MDHYKMELLFFSRVLINGQRLFSINKISFVYFLRKHVSVAGCNVHFSRNVFILAVYFFSSFFYVVVNHFTNTRHIFFRNGVPQTYPKIFLKQRKLRLFKAESKRKICSKGKYHLQFSTIKKWRILNFHKRSITSDPSHITLYYYMNCRIFF